MPCQTCFVFCVASFWLVDAGKSGGFAKTERLRTRAGELHLVPKQPATPPHLGTCTQLPSHNESGKYTSYLWQLVCPQCLN
eukprot:6011774-Lingulodinium_polyedra.AAC.1